MSIEDQVSKENILFKIILVGPPGILLYITKESIHSLNSCWQNLHFKTIHP